MWCRSLQLTVLPLLTRSDGPGHTAAFRVDTTTIQIIKFTISKGSSHYGRKCLSFAFKCDIVSALVVGVGRGKRVFFLIIVESKKCLIIINILPLRKLTCDGADQTLRVTFSLGKSGIKWLWLQSCGEQNRNMNISLISYWGTIMLEINWK